MAKTIATLMGVVFLLVGLAGFVMPLMLGAHPSPAHNVIHLASGAASLYLGLKGTLSAAKTFEFAFGGFYLLLGLAGFVLGTSNGEHASMLALIPGLLEFGQMDHIFHIIIGAAYLAGALMTK